MAGRGILERLGKPSSRYSSTESIVAHLRVLLNSRPGTSLTVPDYGVVDFNDVVHTLPDSIRNIQQSIRTTIETHEPRLKHVNVRYLRTDDSLLLRFEITARLAENPQNVIRLHSNMHLGGLFTVD